MSDRIHTRIVPSSVDAASEAAACLKAGGLVAFATETVYGLGADASDGKAVARLYAAKGRPAFNPLIAHVADLAAARLQGNFSEEAFKLAAAFWPGPLTLVVPQAPGCTVCALATAGLDSVALRVPDHSFAQALLRAFGGAVVAPSANRSGHVSPTTAKHVADDLAGAIDLIVDGGAVAVGVESTIVDCRAEPMLLRPGGITRAAIARVLGRALASAPGTAETPRAPGQLASHYAPRTPLRLGATNVAADEALLAFGPPLQGADPMLNLSVSGNLTEAAAALFGHLRRLDTMGARAIAVMPVPDDGLGEAINDRLRRAAAPKA